jgi:hypothetical protein
MLYLSPLLGSFISTIIMLLYALIKMGVNTESVFTILPTFPIIFFLFSLVSYLLSLPIGIWLIKIKDRNFLSDNMFMFYAWVASTILGLAFSLINFNIEKLTIKSIVIFICFSLGGLFNSSFYIALKRQMKKD